MQGHRHVRDCEHFTPPTLLRNIKRSLIKQELPSLQIVCDFRQSRLLIPRPEVEYVLPRETICVKVNRQIATQLRFRADTGVAYAWAKGPAPVKVAEEIHKVWFANSLHCCFFFY